MAGSWSASARRREPAPGSRRATCSTSRWGTTPRPAVDVPEDLAAALAEAPDARARFDELSYSHQRRYVEAVLAAKRPETRLNRVGRTVEMLRADLAERANRG